MLSPRGGKAMVPGKENLFVELGLPFSKGFVYRDTTGEVVDMTGWLGQVVFRHFRDSVSQILLVDTTSGITLGNDGTITIALTKEQTSAITLPYLMEWGRVGSRYGRVGVWALRLTPVAEGNPGDSFDLLDGSVLFSQDMFQEEPS